MRVASDPSPPRLRRETDAPCRALTMGKVGVRAMLKSRMRITTLLILAAGIAATAVHAQPGKPKGPAGPAPAPHAAPAPHPAPAPHIAAPAPHIAAPHVAP